MKEGEVILRNAFYYVAGLGFLTAAKAKHVLRGYSTPKPFDVSEVDRCIDYDLHVVDHWLGHFERYAGSADLAGADVLELGPGSDLGTGLILLALGCRSYSACDVHDLTRSTPEAFYARLFRRLRSRVCGADLDEVMEQWSAAKAGQPSRLRFAVRSDFDLVAAFGEASIDLVVSQAAFEHFEDIDETIAQVSKVCRPGASIVAEIDLKTHSRWIRDKDPNNIYRYPPLVYDRLRFRGSPNRVRPFEYRRAFERTGWTNVKITPLTSIERFDSRRSGLHGRFAGGENRMDMLTIMLTATKREERAHAAASMSRSA